MDEHGEHQDLRGSGRWSVIPYVYGRMRVVLLKVLTFFLVALCDLESSNARCSLL
jgi:hypothetical protein